MSALPSDTALSGPAGGDSLGQAEDDHRLGIVLFITDGVPSIGETAPERVAERAAAQLGRRRIWSTILFT